MNSRAGVSGRWGKNAIQIDTVSCPHCGSINQTSEISTQTGFPEKVPVTHCKACSKPMIKLAENAEYDLQARYAHWNSTAFQNGLPQIPIEWIRSKRFGGRVEYQYEFPPGVKEPHPVLVRLGKVGKYHGAVAKPGSLRMKISTVYHRNERELDGILLHEMVHVWCASNGHIGEQHGSVFMKKLKEVEQIVGFPLPITDDPSNLELTNPTVKPLGVVLLTKPDGKQIFAVMTPAMLTKALPVIQERAIMMVLNRFAKRVDVYQIQTPTWNRVGVEMPLQRNPKKLKFYSAADSSVIPDLIENGMQLWSHEQHPVVK